MALAEGGDEAAGVPVLDVEFEDDEVDVAVGDSGHQFGGGGGGGHDVDVGLAGQHEGRTLPVEPLAVLDGDPHDSGAFRQRAGKIHERELLGTVGRGARLRLPC